MVLLSNAPDSPWPAIAAEAGWRLTRPDVGKISPPWTDAGLSAILPAAEGRTFLVAEHDLAAAAFYAASRTPHVWMATVAIGGSPRAAIATNRLYAANTMLTPVLWISDQPDARLERGRFNLEVRPTATAMEVVNWLNARNREAFPPEVDCETGNPKLARCFWAEITGFDARRRNDVLDSTRIWAGSGAYLDLGGFGFQPGGGGPGSGGGMAAAEVFGAAAAGGPHCFRGRKRDSRRGGLCGLYGPAGGCQTRRGDGGARQGTEED